MALVRGLSAVSLAARHSRGLRLRRAEGAREHRRASTAAAGAHGAGDGDGDGDEAGGWPRCVVSGLQPTGALHVGNYFGALRRCVRAQDDGDDVVLFVADLHALTAPAPGLQERTAALATLALAAGVDPARTVLFAQSAVPRHAELCWLLACLTTAERLSHLPQCRERNAGGGSGGTALGVLLYPVLQAADVLLYRGTHVPVGLDQLPHLQLSAQLARAFNRRHGRAFPEPRAWLADDGGDRVRSLRAPHRKMSKSDPDPKSRVLLTDSEDAIRRKVRKAVTDFTPRVTFEPEERPGVANLVRLHCLAADMLPEEAVEESDGLTTAQYKEVVASALCLALRGLRARAAELAQRPRLVRDVLRAGAASARRRADRTWADAARLAGLAAPALPLPTPQPQPQPQPEPLTAAEHCESDKISASNIK